MKKKKPLALYLESIGLNQSKIADIIKTGDEKTMRDISRAHRLYHGTYKPDDEEFQKLREAVNVKLSADVWYGVFPPRFEKGIF